MFARTTHATLLRHLAAGDQPAAWVEFCDRYGELIRSFARRQGIQQADCDDVLQDVLLGLSRDMPTFEYDPARGRFRGYLKTVTLHVIFKRRRRKTDRAPVRDLDEELTAACTAPDLDQVWEAEWRQYHIRQAMQTIEAEFSEGDRLAFQHYAVHGRDVRSTAEALRMSVDQVYQAKSRIARRLSELIEQQVVEEG